VTLGTPHQGTELARIGKVFPLIRQLHPESDLIAELAEPAPDCSTRFLAFYSDLDQLIVPRRNAAIDHPDLNARSIAVKGVGHLSMPNNARIGYEIASVLRELDPNGTNTAAAPIE
jgi:triacylglycerol lipase